MTVPLNGPAIERYDSAGRPVSLTGRWTRKSAVLFTGAAGLGVTAQLNRVHEAATAAGAVVLRVKASAHEPLEHRFARTVADQLGPLRRRHGLRATHRLRKTIQALTRTAEDSRAGPEFRTPSPWGMLPQFVYKWRDNRRTAPPATMNDLANAVGELARRQGMPALIVIDDVHRADVRDLAVVNELAEHLEQSGQPVKLVMGGGKHTATMLQKASGGANGVPSDSDRLYDIRPCKPFTPGELEPILQHALRQAVQQAGRHLRRSLPPDVYCAPQHQAAMLHAANGNAARLADVVSAAVDASGNGQRMIDADITRRAVSVVDVNRQAVYQAEWNNSSAAERHLMLRVSRAGEHGLDLAAEVAQIGPDPAGWAVFDAARQSLDGRGVLDASPDGTRLSFCDPGMLRWVAHHNPMPRDRPAAPDRPMAPWLVPGSPLSGQPPAGRAHETVDRRQRQPARATSSGRHHRHDGRDSW